MANSILTINQITGEDLDHYTVLKLLHEVIGKTNELVGSTNGVYEILTYLLNEGLTEEIVDVLNQWLEDGTLADLITEEVLGELNNRIKDLEADNVIVKASGEDDTEALQAILDLGKNIISLPGQEYHTSQPLYIKKDNQFIDMNGSTIIFSQDQNNPHTTGSSRTNHIGVFNIRSTDYGVSHNVTAANMEDGVLTLDSLQGINIGDWIQIDLGCYDTVYNEAWLSPTWSTVSKVLNVNTSENKIHIEYSCEQWIIPEGDITGTARIVKPKMNCSVKNVIINDITPIRNGHVTSGSIVYPAADSHYACAGIGIANAVYCNIENVVHNNGMFSTIHATWVSHSTFKNIQTYTPRLLGGGEGYNTQCIDCFDMDLIQLKGYKTRHTIDASGGGYLRYNNIQSVQSPTSDVQFHGKYEHDIVITGLRGDGQGNYLPYVNAGSGTEFGNASANVTFRDSEFVFISSMATNFIKDLLIDNCKVTMHRATGQVRISNSTVTLDDFILKIPVTRGQATYMELDNSKVWLKDTNQTIGLYGRLSITGCDIEITTKTDSELGLWIANCSDVVLSGNRINACIWLSNDDAKYGARYTAYSITGNIIACFRYGGLFFKDYSKSNVVATISGNTFYKSRKYTGSSQPYSIDFDGNSKSDSNLKVVITGNLIDDGRIFKTGLDSNTNATYVLVNNIGTEV